MAGNFRGIKDNSTIEITPNFKTSAYSVDTFGSYKGHKYNAK